MRRKARRGLSGLSGGGPVRCPRCHGLGHLDTDRAGSLCMVCRGTGIARGDPLLLDAVDHEMAHLEARLDKSQKARDGMRDALSMCLKFFEMYPENYPPTTWINTALERDREAV